MKNKLKDEKMERKERQTRNVRKKKKREWKKIAMKFYFHFNN